jgi:hypothetical protein
MTNLTVKALREDRLAIFEGLVKKLAAERGMDLGDSNTRESIEMEIDEMCRNFSADVIPSSERERLIADYIGLGKKIMELDDGDLDDDDRLE